MSDDMDDDFRRADHSIGSADQANYQDDFDDWDWLEQEMQREAEENEREREAWNKEMERQIAYSKRLANMTVKYMNSKSQEIHASKPYPSCQLDCGSFREAWLETLHEGNNPDRYLSLHQLRDRRQTTKKPLRAEILQHRSPREVLLHDLDSSRIGPISLDATELTLDGQIITDSWSWSDLLQRSGSNRTVHVHIASTADKQAADQSTQPSQSPAKQDPRPMVLSSKTVTIYMAASGNKIADIELGEGQRRVQDVAIQLQPQVNATRFQQRLLPDEDRDELHGRQLLDSDTNQLFLILLPYIDICQNDEAELLDAIEEGNTTKVEAILHRPQHPDQTACQDYQPTALVLAAHNNHTDIVDLLLEARADVARRSNSRALLEAIWNENLPVTEMLLAARATPHPQPEDESTPLQEAVVAQNWDIMSLLLEAGARPNDRDQEGNTALHFACDQPYIQPVLTLLQYRANLEATNDDGETLTAVAQAAAAMRDLVLGTCRGPSARHNMSGIRESSDTDEENSWECESQEDEDD
ncbi:MIB1 [Symbiodinium necroappetens]|uniref:MIB1 protein n=1 Tax=Symbiodinium necroappetens TaxID=1628268 RepID=A0A813AR41_9DINO|nr:MIB1 [Symbiodinium necroappetens]